MQIKVRELKGIKSLNAMNAFSALLLGLKMLPAYAGVPYEEFYEAMQKLTPAEQEKLLREAAMFVKLEKDEVESIASFAEDPNGVPYSPENIGNLGPAEMIDVIVAVCMEFAKIRVVLVTDSQKKKSKTSRLTSGGSSRSTRT